MENKCENCIHYDACKHISDVHGLCFGSSPFCDHYKDKSLCRELPCKVGDKVYLFDKALNILEFVISSYVIYSYGDCHFVARHKRDGWPVSKIFWSYEIGKTVFLSKEEAEEKKKRNRGKLWLMKRKIVRM